MKKIYLLLVATGFLTLNLAHAQTQKNWSIVGGDLANLRLGFQKKNTTFDLDLTPRVAWFIDNNLALGISVLAGISTGDGFTDTKYGIGPVVRYYTGKSLESLRKTRWFADANIGFEGTNSKVTGQASTSTNGIGIGIGPGLAYFITQNVALEALAKYNLIAGFGNSTTDNSFSLQIGFQVHLPRAKLRSIQKNDVK